MITNRIGPPGFLSSSQLRDLAAKHHLNGSDSFLHPIHMSQLSRSELLREWNSRRACQEDILRAPVEIASVPGGYYSRIMLKAAAEAGYGILFYSEPTSRIREVERCRLIGRYYLQHAPVKRPPISPPGSGPPSSGRVCPGT